jgi:hypothetical protein
MNPLQNSGLPAKGKDYILYDYIPHRSFRQPRRPRSPWPSPMLKQGPYWVVPTEQGLQCVPRRGTRAYQRMLKRQAEQQQVGEFVVAFFVAIVAVLFFALAL